MTRSALLGLGLLLVGGCADLPQPPMDTDGSSSGSNSTGQSSVDGSTSAGSVCGNDVIDPEEDCDGDELSATSCEELGMGGGTLACSDDCTYDTSGCDTPSVCGNGRIEAGEDCESSDLGAESCLTQGFASGRLSCDDDCNFDTSECSEYVGDCCSSNITPGCEDPQCSVAVCNQNPLCCNGAWGTHCVEAALDEVTCQGVGGSCPELGDCCESHDSPGCTDTGCTDSVCATRPSCCKEEWSETCAFAATLDSSCQGVGGSCPSSHCGDGYADPIEICDGADLVGQECATQGFEGGTLRCLDDCSGFDTSECGGFAGNCCLAHMALGCQDAKCASVVCEADAFCCEVGWDELCAQTAADALACKNADPSCPTDPDACGDGVAQTDEVCDDGDLNGQDCGTEGFGGEGDLKCSDDCTSFDTSECDYDGECCAANGTPGCEDSECASIVCAINPSCCDDVWNVNCAGFASLQCVGLADCTCGDGVLQEGDEECEDAHPVNPFPEGDSCLSRGYASGDLDCTNNCTIDTMGCLAYDGDCCTGNGTPGCSDQICTQHICDIAGYEYCCTEGWDQGCADTANHASACHGSGGTCPIVMCDGTAQRHEPCDGDDLREETCESLGYSGGELACEAGCVGFDESGCWQGSCCEANGTPGCDNSACAGAIIGIDPFCGDTEWDWLCAAQASVNDLCKSLPTCPSPACGDGFAEGHEVCDLDDLAGQSCISLGFGGGQLACSGNCGDFNTTGCFTGDCCSDHGQGPGCEDPTCTEAICAMGEAGAECCNTAWTQSCADAAAVHPACQGVGGSCPL